MPLKSRLKYWIFLYSVIIVRISALIQIEIVQTIDKVTAGLHSLFMKFVYNHFLAFTPSNLHFKLLNQSSFKWDSTFKFAGKCSSFSHFESMQSHLLGFTYPLLMLFMMSKRPASSFELKSWNCNSKWHNNLSDFSEWRSLNNFQIHCWSLFCFPVQSELSKRKL